MDDEIHNYYIIGDVHGCYHTLMRLVGKLPVEAKLIFVGDLCDRGLYTKEVIEFIINNGCLAISGNHEYYMKKHAKEALEGLAVRWTTEAYMGGIQTLQSYKNDEKTLYTHLEWIEKLPAYIIKDNYFITHAFCLPYYQRRDDPQKVHAMMVNRLSDEQEWGWDWEESWKEYHVINIFGHDAQNEVVVGTNFFGIDTGCVYGNKLTALQLGTMKLFEQALDRRDISDKPNIYVKG